MRRQGRSWTIGWICAAVVALLGTFSAVGSAQSGRDGSVASGPARIWYTIVGAGDPVIVVHGGPGLDHRYLRPGLDVLARKHALVYYDQRGTGRSAVDVGPETIDIEAFVADIEAVRRALGHSRVHLMSHSFGSQIALAYARAHPARVRSLVLLNPVDPGTRFLAETQRRRSASRTAADAEALRELTTSEGYEDRDPATLEQVFRVSFRSAMHEPDRVAEIDLTLSERTAAFGQDVARWLGGAFSRVDGWEHLAALGAPTLVVHGRYDLAPLTLAEALARAIPDARLEVLDTGHFPYVEDPERLAEVVTRFLAGTPGR